LYTEVFLNIFWLKTFSNSEIVTKWISQIILTSRKIPVLKWHGKWIWLWHYLDKRNMKYTHLVNFQH